MGEQLASNNEADKISEAASALKIDSTPTPNDEETTESNPMAHGKSHDDSAHGTDKRPSVTRLTAVEHVSDGAATLGASTKSDSTPGVQKDDTQDLLHATATSDKRGSETGIF